MPLTSIRQNSNNIFAEATLVSKKIDSRRCEFILKTKSSQIWSVGLLSWTWQPCTQTFLIHLSLSYQPWMAKCHSRVTHKERKLAQKVILLRIVYFEEASHWQRHYCFQTFQNPTSIYKVLSVPVHWHSKTRKNSDTGSTNRQHRGEP